MHYDQVVTQYREKLSSPSAIPVVSRNNVEGLSPTQEEQLANLQAIQSKFVERAATLTDEILDRYQAPHPLMGMLTAREWLYFTHYHTGHHMNSMMEMLTIS